MAKTKQKQSKQSKQLEKQANELLNAQNKFKPNDIAIALTDTQFTDDTKHTKGEEILVTEQTEAYFNVCHKNYDKKTDTTLNIAPEVSNTITIQDSSLTFVSTTSVEQSTQQENVMNETTETTTETPTVAAEVNKKQLVLDFIAAHPELADKNKLIAEKIGNGVTPEYVAQIKQQQKKKSEPAKKGFDISAFKIIVNMQKKVNDAGGVESVTAALNMLEPLLLETGSIDDLKLMLDAIQSLQS